MNKNKLKTVLGKVVKYLAALTVKKYQPGIIAISGSVGKTSTKEAIYEVMKISRSVRASSGNFNNEFGLPLTVLGDYKKISGKFFWMKVVIKSVLSLIFTKKYPEILVLEFAAAKPGDMKYLLDMVRPQVGVMTAVGEIPAHVEFYSGPEAVAREKAKIIEILPSTGFAVLNFDDQAILDMRTRTRAHVLTYGFGDGAEIKITNFENRMDGFKPAGVSFKLNYGGSFVPIRLDGCFGKAPAYAAAAAAGVGLMFGINLVKIAEALSFYKPLEGRMSLEDGIKGTFIINDSYNASPLSMHSAIETVKSLKAKRKVAVLGDMMEIGKYTIEAHENIGIMAGKTFDMLVTIGARAKFIADTAAKAGIPKKNIFSFDNAEEAKLKVQELIKRGDLIL
ncbi:MAG: Mur ligase family protein, partial [Candidatus Pacebacteria bacterium]|nr:Mur ligase family protein [Candidatus Paceibacterota bacterium]